MNIVIGAGISLLALACKPMLEKHAQAWFDENVEIGIQTARVTQNESFDQEYRYIGKYYATTDLTYRDCLKPGATQCAQKQCILAQQVINLIGVDMALILQAEYSEFLSDVEPCPEGDGPEDEQIRSKLAQVAAFGAGFRDGRIALSGDVDFQLAMDPMDPEEQFYVSGSGSFRASIEYWQMVWGEFAIVNTNAFALSGIRKAKYMDFEVELYLVPLPSQRAWSPFKVADAPKSNQPGDPGSPAKPTKPTELNVPAKPTWSTKPTERTVPHAFPRALYRIYVNFPEHNGDLMEIDYKRGHVIGTDKGEPIGCLFFDGRSGVRIIDFADLGLVRSYGDRIVRDDTKIVGSPVWLLPDAELEKLCAEKSKVKQI